MQRRTFIKTASAAMATVLLPKMVLAAQQATEKLPSFGIITSNTGGDWVKNNPEEALREIARLGYKYLEFGEDFGFTNLPDLKKFLDNIGLDALIGPTTIRAMNDTALLEKNIERCHLLGNKYIVCYWPWADDDEEDKEKKTLDDWKKVAEKLNKGGEICKRNGLQLLYHNHDIEFKLTEGKIPFDLLMANLDKNHVNIEFDLYWITKGEHSAIEYIRKYPGWYPVFHVKDMAHTDDKGFACPGEGRIDFPEIFKLHQTAGVKHYIVEHDNPANPKECITASAKYLSELRF